MIKILAIDDNKDNLISLRAIVQDAFPDSTLFTATNGVDGIELAITRELDVILLDIIMPDMDGFEVCRQLKSDDRTLNIPVVFLTALGGDMRSHIKALEVGAEAFLSKPIDVYELTAQIRAMVKIKTAYEEKRDEKVRLKKLVFERTKALEKELIERKRAEEAVKKSEERFRHISSSISDISYSCKVDTNGDNIIDWLYGATEKITGYSRDEIFAMKCWGKIVVDEDFPIFKSHVLGVLPDTSDFCQLRLKKKDGSIVWVQVTVECVKEHEEAKSAVLFGGLVDITEQKMAEESLQEINRLNKSLLQTIPFGMNIVDEFGNILFINDNLAKYFGDNVIGQKCWMLYRDDQKQCVECPLFKGIEIGETELYESIGILGGRTFQISYTGMMFQGKKAMLEIFQDITEKKEIEKRINLLAHSLESISECVSVTDNNDIIIYVNKSFLHTYGYTADELIGQHTSMLLPMDIAMDHVRDILPETIDGGWRGEILNRKKDGTLFPILLSTSIIKDDDDNPIALIGVAIDISEMRKSRMELIAAKEQAEESNHLKSAFLNNMSHEIRTPMNHIMGFSSLMAEAKGEEKDSYAEIILNSSNQLLTLIENVILLSRLQSEKPEANNQEFDPVVLVTNIVKMFNLDELKNNITLRVRIPEEHPNLSILSDLEKIRQIMINLTSNAIKYTFGGFIELGFDYQPESIKFYVKDSGIGIPIPEQQKVFDSFYRSEQATSLAIGGAGLGLSIVKELVGSLNGTLGVESEPGNGSCFYFTIPLEQSDIQEKETKSAQIAHQPLEDITILIADDEQINFQYLEILLKNRVKKLDHAYNGKKAVEMASKYSYNLILMDLNMPEMDGYQATKKLKQNFPAIPIIAQTAYATTEDREKAMLAGCDDFIAKPIKKEVLIEMIQKYS